jgi:MoaA/NifB/PqqE/SkfB family radical SAM enzyme
MNLFKYRYADQDNMPLPLSYTLGLTHKCNARCKTCFIYENRPINELKPEEWERILLSLGNSPHWVTFTGGEPFLYKDIEEVYYLLVDLCSPKIVNIPTNGQLTERIVEQVWDMAKMCRDTKLIINVSLDHYLPFKNDEIRGVEGYYRNAAKTIDKLNKIHAPNLTVGIHTVVSKYNVNELPAIAINLRKLLKDPNNFITEIAEHRKELRTVGKDIQPTDQDYSNAIECLLIKQNGRLGLSKIKQSLRRQYYENVIKYLNTGTTGLRCLAGSASVQIDATGEVWNCCIKTLRFGNIRTVNYDLKRLWNTPRAIDVRKQSKDCSCPLANASYTNMLASPKHIYRTAKESLIG